MYVIYEDDVCMFLSIIENQFIRRAFEKKNMFQSNMIDN